MFIIFDLDHTLFTKNASVAFGAFLYRRGKIPFSKMIILLGCYLLYKCKIICIKKLHGTIFSQLFLGREAAFFLQEVDQFLDSEMALLLDKTIYEKLCQSEGYAALFSSSPDFLVNAVAKHLHISSFLGTPYEINDEGKFSEIKHVISGEDKAFRAKIFMRERGLSPNDTWAYTDSILDLALLESVGHPVAVNPDRALKKICIKRNWAILNTEKK